MRRCSFRFLACILGFRLQGCDGLMVVTMYLLKNAVTELIDDNGLALLECTCLVVVSREGIGYGGRALYCQVSSALTYILDTRFP